MEWSTVVATQSRAGAHVVDVPAPDQHAGGPGEGLHRGAHGPTIATHPAAATRRQPCPRWVTGWYPLRSPRRRFCPIASPAEKVVEDDCREVLEPSRRRGDRRRQRRRSRAFAVLDAHPPCEHGHGPRLGISAAHCVSPDPSAGHRCGALTGVRDRVDGSTCGLPRRVGPQM